MAELYKGRVIRMSFGGMSAGDIRVLERLLDATDGVEGFTLDAATRTLTAFIDEPNASEHDIVKAMIASGLYPMVPNPTGTDGEGRPAC